MIKLAQNPSPVEIMSLYVAFLRAIYQIFQDAHWKSKGPEFYSKHLLFQRLYEQTQETVDDAAEKTIGVFGELKDYHDVIKDVCNKFEPENHDGDFVMACLKAEEMFLAFSQQIYNSLKEMDAMTLGLDDFIMSVASKHEVHVYLLKQSLSQ
jgi:starvation-inducible DNA-binding protein